MSMDSMEHLSCNVDAKVLKDPSGIVKFLRGLYKFLLIVTV